MFSNLVMLSFVRQLFSLADEEEKPEKETDRRTESSANNDSKKKPIKYSRCHPYLRLYVAAVMGGLWTILMLDGSQYWWPDLTNTKKVLIIIANCLFFLLQINCS